MDFKLAIDHLNSLQATGIKLGLERIRYACKLLGDPQDKFPSIIVAGTNGKGSTCAFLESILRHHGLKVGLYTSPHLVDVRERIQIGREMISESDFARISSNIVQAISQSHNPTISLTYFEFLNALGFLYFAEQHVDIAIVEVGLGGRYDSTNIVTPLVSVITRIGLDHQKYLGDTIEAITQEKCGVIKNGVPVVTIDQAEEAMNVIRRVADENGSMLNIVRPYDVKWKLALEGRHQQENAACAYRAAEILFEDQLNRKLEPEKIKDAFASTGWAGRLEVVSREPLIILDGAHNPNGAEVLAKYIRTNLKDKRKVMILGIMADKDVDDILKSLADVGDEFIVTRPNLERAAAPSFLKERLEAICNKPVRVMESVHEAIEGAKCAMGKGDALIIAGSLYLIGEAKEYFK